MNPDDSQHASKTKATNNSSFVKVLLLIVAAALAVTLVVINLRNENSTTTSPEPLTNQGITLSINPSTKTVAQDEEFTAELWVDALDQNVNTVEAFISYPQETLEYIGIDATESAFELEVIAKTQDGVLQIARGQIGGVTGRKLVAKLKFVPRTDEGSASLSFTDASSVLSSTDNNNVLSLKSGATFTLGESQ